MEINHIILAKFIGSEYWHNILLKQLLSQTTKPEMSCLDELDLMQNQSDMMGWAL